MAILTERIFVVFASKGLLESPYFLETLGCQPYYELVEVFSDLAGH